MGEAKVFLAIDPGLKNCAAVLCEVWSEGETQEVHVETMWSQVWDLSGEMNPDFRKAQEFGEELVTLLANFREVDAVLIEYQPPLNVFNNPALVRWNSWMEGFLFGYLQPEAHVKHSFSSAVKKFFHIQGGNHTVNKRLTLRKAKEYIKDVKTDHEADCILMCVYEFLRKQRGI